MKNYAITGLLSLTLLGFAVLIHFSVARSAGQGPDKKSDKTAHATDMKAAAGLPVEQAEQAEFEGEFETALKYYIEINKARPKWADVQLKIAVCLAALNKKEEAANTLRDVLKKKSASVELLSQARAALQELLLPKLSDEQRQEWKQALSLIQTGEELKQHESEDLEIRTEHKVFAGPYQEAIKKLEKLTKDLPDFAPAFLSVGAAHESLLHFEQAADGYRKFLEFGSKNKLPELEQQAQIRQRMLVCQWRSRIDQDLATRVPGLWEVVYDRGGERPTVTTTPPTTTTSEMKTTGDKTTTTTTTPETKTTTVNASGFADGCELELLPGGGVNHRDGAGWKWDKDTYWKVVNKQLIVGGLVDTPSEWCNIGPLVPSGNRSEGLTMDLDRTRYVRKGPPTRLYCIQRGGTLFDRRPVVGGDWRRLGEVANVTHFAADQGRLYCVTSDGALWDRQPVVGADWRRLGEAANVTHFAADGGKLYCIQRGGALLERRPVAGGDWRRLGEAANVTHFAADGGKLYCIQRGGALFDRQPGVGGDWRQLGQVSDITHFAADQGRLYCVTSDGALWDRQPVVGGDWRRLGAAANVTYFAADGACPEVAKLP